MRGFVTTIMRVTAVLLTCTAVTGCFTGVESTPRITDADVRRDVQPHTPDETYMAGITPPALGEWQVGKPLYVTDARIIRALSSESYGGRQLAAGDTLRYAGSHAARSLAGDPVTELSFTGPDGRTYTYSLDREADSAAVRPVRVPFTIDLQMLDEASKLLLGRKFYIVTSGRRLADGTFARFRKYIPVTVSEVLPGTPENPVRVRLADDMADATYLYINPEVRSSRAAGSFASMLSLVDPRKRWPAISDKVWQLIVSNEVEPGMTREEVRLAVGAPAEIIRRPGYSYMHEAWRYDTGRYLIFEDGILVK